MLSRLSGFVSTTSRVNRVGLRKTPVARASAKVERSFARSVGENALRKLTPLSIVSGEARVAFAGTRSTGGIATRAYATDQGQSWNSLPPGYGEQLQNLRTGPKNQDEDPMPGDGSFRKGFGGGMGWGAFLLFTLVGGAIWYYGRKRRLEIEEMRKRVVSVGDVKIGGTWSLVDHEGRPVTSANFLGKYPLIYFGFTYCPDICPLELQKMAKALNMLPPEAQNLIEPLMFSVDPWRDSLAHLSGYVQEFHPKLRGLVGTPQQVDDVTRKFRVYTSKGPEETEGDYLMDHSIFMYFMGKDGKFLDYYGVSLEPEEIAESIKNHLVANGDLPEEGPMGALRWWWKNRNAKTNTM